MTLLSPHIDLILPLPCFSVPQFWTKEQEAAAWNANVRGGLEGTAIATAITVPGYYLLHRSLPAFRQLPLPLKAFGITVVAVPCIIINAEKAGEAYERSQWTGLGKEELDRTEIKEAQRWDGLSSGQKVQDWASRHKWGIVGGS